MVLRAVLRGLCGAVRVLRAKKAEAMLPMDEEQRADFAEARLHADTAEDLREDALLVRVKAEVATVSKASALTFQNLLKKRVSLRKWMSLCRNTLFKTSLLIRA